MARDVSSMGSSPSLVVPKTRTPLTMVMRPKPRGYCLPAARPPCADAGCGCIDPLPSPLSPHRCSPAPRGGLPYCICSYLIDRGRESDAGRRWDRKERICMHERGSIAEPGVRAVVSWITSSLRPLLLSQTATYPISIMFIRASHSLHPPVSRSS